MKKVIVFLNDYEQVLTSAATAVKNKYWITYDVEVIAEPEINAISAEEQRQVPKPGNLMMGFGSHVYRLTKVEPVYKCFSCAESYDDRQGSNRIGNRFYCKKHFNELVITKPIRRATQKTNRNAPCPCGSGKKYKQCCITKDTHTRARHYFNSEYKQAEQTKKTA